MKKFLVSVSLNITSISFSLFFIIETPSRYMFHLLISSRSLDVSYFPTFSFFFPVLS